MKRTDQARLNAEYQRLVSGLAESGLGRSSGGVGGAAGGSGAGGSAGELSSAADSIPANPALPADILQEAVPGNIRRAEHFVSFMRKVGVPCFGGGEGVGFSGVAGLIGPVGLFGRVCSFCVVC